MTTQANANAKAKSVSKYLKGVRAELKKVNWPNKTELKNHTAVVIVSCGLAIIVLWALDTFFGLGLNLIIK